MSTPEKAEGNVPSSLEIVESVLLTKGVTGVFGITLGEDGQVSLVTLGKFRGDSLLMLGGISVLQKLTDAASGIQVVTTKKP